MSLSPIIVKVGGSLFGLRDLRERLQQWLKTLPTREVILVPGGGPTADVIRNLDRSHSLGEEKAHWLALRALALNAHFLADLLSSAEVINDLSTCSQCWLAKRVPILDAHAFALADEKRPRHLPHTWAVTSDSLAARVAVVAGAPLLILLKSVSIPEGTDWAEAGRRGWVDPMFGEVLQQVASLRVQAVNLCEWHT
jgi:aspartokinase-like uncharacterized kinase